MNALSWIVDDSFSMRLTVTLLHFLWQGCCVGLVVMVCGSLLTGATARLRYALNVASMLVMAACLPMTFVLVGSNEAVTTRPLASQPIHDTPSPHSKTIPISVHRVEPGISVASGIIEAGEPIGERSPTSEMGGAPTELSSSRVSPNEWVHSFSSMLSVEVFPTLSRWIAPLYLAGVACILGRLVFGLWGGHRLRRMAILIEDDTLLASFQKLADRLGLKVAPTVAWCEQISIPVVVGIVKPMILLPIAVVSNLTPDQLQALMLHELSHIRRFDPVVNLLQRIVEAILFFHPVVWFVSRRISIEREHVADDMVIAAGWERPVYAEALVRVAELAATFSGRNTTERAVVLGAAGSNPSEFKLRILRLLDASRPPRLAFSRTGILLVLSFILMGGVFAWSQTHHQDPQRDPVRATASDPTALPEPQPIPQETEPRQENTSHPKGLEFLRAYPALHAVSLDMTEPQFLEIIQQQKLKTRKSADDGKVQHHIALGDGHTLIVIFDKNEKCSGIQRVRGEDNSGGPTELRTMREPSFRLPGHSNITGLGFDNNSTELVAVSTYHFATIRRWDLVGMKLKNDVMLSSDRHLRPFREGSFKLSGDGRRVIAATDEYVGIWNTATGNLLKKLPFPTKEGIYDCWIDKLDGTPDLSVIVGNWAMPGRLTLAYDARVMIWDGNSGKLLKTVIDKNGTTLHSIDLSTDGKLLATTNGGGAKVWETSTGKLLRSFLNDNAGRKHSDPEVSNDATRNVWCVQLSPDGKQLAMGDILGVKLFDVASGKLLQLLEGPHRYGLGTLVFSKDGRLLARTGTGDRVEEDKTSYVVPIWSTQTGEKRFELHTESGSGAFSDDNTQFAVGLSDWEMALAVFQLSGSVANTTQLTPESTKDKVAVGTHCRGKEAEEFIDDWKPVWGEPELGIRYGIALTTPQRQFRVGERVPMAIFLRNVSDKPLQIDTRPDFFGNTPKVVDAKGGTVGFETVPLLGTTPHYVENLEPGEAVGPLYLNIGLGENPRPGEQHWHLYFKTPAAGTYELTHSVSIDVVASKDGEKPKHSQITSGRIEFEIAGMPLNADGGSSKAIGGSDKASQTLTREAEEDRQPIGTLLDSFSNAHSVWQQLEVAREIIQLRDKTAIARIRPFLESANRRTRCNAGLLLARLGDQRGRDTLINELQDTKPRPIVPEDVQGKPDAGRQILSDRYYAALLLGELGDKEAVPALITATDDETINDRAAISLGEIADRQAIPALRKMAKEFPQQRLWAGYGLAALGESDGFQILTEATSDAVWTQRRHAVEALGKIGNPQMVPTIVKALKDEHTNVRVSAVRALGQIGDPAALPALRDALKDTTATEVHAPTTVAAEARKAIDAVEAKQKQTSQSGDSRYRPR